MIIKQSLLATSVSIFFFITLKLNYAICQTNWTFSNLTDAAGFHLLHGYEEVPPPLAWRVAGGVAAGDFNNDGWVDLYLERGNIGANLLYKNKGDGTFEEMGIRAGVALSNYLGSGPLFFDYNGDGWLDLLLGSIDNSGIRVFKNETNETFTEVSASLNIHTQLNTQSASAGDFNGDGFLDLFLSHWYAPTNQEHLWQNIGGNSFLSADEAVGLHSIDPTAINDFSFTSNFTDINLDGHPDILISADFGTSQIWLHDAQQHFTNTTNTVISDENGMGSAIGDYDNDGDLDWFVSSIFDGDGVTEGNWGTSGNRLYRNYGDGSFEDVTEQAGVRMGDWGWGSSFADLNNDGFLDLVHVNGWPQGSAQFHHDTTKIFINNGHGQFEERFASLNLVDTGQGRGLVCFDYDRDGDIDIFISNYEQLPSLWRNDGGNQQNWLTIKPQWKAPNVAAVGAFIKIFHNGQQQVREIRCGSNYVSQNPMEAHFGLGTVSEVDSIRIRWPDNSIQLIRNVAVNQFLKVAPLSYSNTSHKIDVKPNPFSNFIEIVVTLATSKNFSLKIINIYGEEVASLAYTEMYNNRFSFIWKGTDAKGNSLSNGIYFIQIITNEQLLFIHKIIKTS